MKRLIWLFCSCFVFAAHADLNDALSLLIDRMIEQQASVETLDQQMVTTITYGLDDGEESVEEETRMLFRRPDRLLLESSSLRLAADGEKLRLILDEMQAYLEFPWEDSLASTLEPQLMYLGMTLLPDLLALISTDPRQRLVDFVEQVDIEILEDTEVEGRICWQLKIWSEQLDEMGNADLRAMIDQETGLLQALRFRVEAIDIPGMEDVAGIPKWMSVEMQSRGRLLNESIPDRAFEANVDGFKRAAHFEELIEQAHAGMLMEEEALLGEPAPEFELELLNGEVFRLADYRGQVVLIDFWATWCPPCVESLPYLQSLHEDVGDRLTLIGVSVDRAAARSRVESMVEQFGITYLVGVNDDSRIAVEYGASAIPTLVLVDQEGIIREVKTGFSAAAMDDLKQRALALLEGAETL